MERPSPRQLLVECAMCRRPFETGIAADQRPPDAAGRPGAGGSGDGGSERIHECPFCGFTTAYASVDYR